MDVIQCSVHMHAVGVYNDRVIRRINRQIHADRLRLFAGVLQRDVQSVGWNACPYPLTVGTRPLVRDSGTIFFLINGRKTNS